MKIKEVVIGKPYTWDPDPQEADYLEHSDLVGKLVVIERSMAPAGKENKSGSFVAHPIGDRSHPLWVFADELKPID